MNEEVEKLVAIEVARQLTAVLPALKTELASLVKPIQTDLVALSYDLAQNRHNLSTGYANRGKGPSADELATFLPNKIKESSLREVVSEVAASHGVDISNPKAWSVYAGVDKADLHE